MISIESNNIEGPQRVEYSFPEQLVLQFDDIYVPIDDFIEPQETYIQRAIRFSDKKADSSLLIHCHAGISHSSAIGLATIP